MILAAVTSPTPGSVSSSSAVAVLISILCDVPDGLELPDGVRSVLYRIAQEALNNVTKHAHASHASISVVEEGNSVELRVSDDGSGGG